MRTWTLMAALGGAFVLAGCPDKKTPAEPESANAAAPASARAPAQADTSGAPKQEDEEDDEEGGW